ncbi:VPH1 [Malassezia furfur]|nr:VPH1 [Malassezia furfur]
MGGEESLFRSATMSLIQLYMPSESVHATVTELGELGTVQFKDLNPDAAPFQRTFVADIRRLDEMERRVQFLEEQLEREAIPARPLESALPMLGGAEATRTPLFMEQLATQLNELGDRVGQMNSSYTALQRRLQELEEAKHVIRETAVFFEHAEAQPEQVRLSMDDDAPHAPLLDGARPTGIEGMRAAPPASFDLEFVAGTIDRAQMATLERVLWRALRGNLFMNYAEIPQGFADASHDDLVFKNVFVIFAHGATVLAKIRKIAESMGGTLFPVESDAAQRDARLHDVLERIEDHENILHSTSAARRAELLKAAESITAWHEVVRKEKLVYATMNLFQNDPRQKTMVAEGWTPTSDLPGVQLALRRATEDTGAHVSSVLQVLPTKATPPTYQRVNKFTEGFQAIIDAYGFATYQEVNPGLFAVITFPFLFAVMFGDIGHGVILLLCAGAMVAYEQKMLRTKLDEITSMFFYGRYIILLMGAFAVFTGLLYNDIFSLSMHLWHTGWEWPRGEGSLTAEPTGRVYPIGLDPTWHGAENNLVFTNSLKMKLSIVLGVAQMTFALLLNVPNHIHFKRPSWIWAELVPQILFMESLFGYLVITIVYKWSVDWYATDADGHSLRNSPPGLLNMLIYMFLKPGVVDPNDQLFPGQASVQSFLLLLALVCVPWMLVAKPYLLYQEHKRAEGYHTVGSARGEQRIEQNEDEREVFGEEDDTVEAHHGGDGEEEEEFEIGEVVIHQIIHTIEFCLGCISNTASYLRLWALSLAHAQLSQVLWDMTIKNVFGMTGIFGVMATMFAFALWFILTIFILCIMEGLSAFLHALRLHWVEAGSKHYEAGGYPFEPLTFRADDA